MPLLSLEMERMHASASVIGANTALSGVASILALPFVPRLGRKLGVVRLLLLAILLAAASLVAFKLLFSVTWWFPIRFAFSVALGTLFTVSEYWISAAAPADRRGLAVGIYATVLGIGFALGPALLALFGTTGWSPYLVGTGLFLLGTVPVLLGRDLSPPLGSGPRWGVWHFLTVAPSATMAALVFGAVEMGGFALLPVYGLELGLSPERAATLVSAVALGSVALQIPLGMVSDRVDRRALLLVTSVTASVAAALMPLAAAHGIALELVLLVWGGLCTALYTVGLGHLGARYAGGDLAGANTAFVICYNVGMILGPAVAGAAMDVAPRQGLAWSLAGVLGAYGVFVATRIVLRRA